MDSTTINKLATKASGTAGSPAPNKTTDVTRHDGTSTTAMTPEAIILSQMHRIEESLNRMEAKTRVQRNISTVVTDGMAVIREAMECARVECMRMSERRTREDRGGVGQTSTPQTKRKRETTGSTPEMTPAKKPAESSEWKTAGRKTKPRTDPGKARATAPPPTKTGTTTKKAKSGRRTRNATGGVVLIKPSTGQTYADIVRKMRAVDPAAAKVQVSSYHKTRDGGVLLRLKSGAEHRQNFQEKLRQTLGDSARLGDVTPGVSLEIMDLDCVTDKDEVTDALRRETGLSKDPKVHIFGPNKRGLCMAVCDLEEGAANALLRKGRLKIGWVSCRVRSRLTVPRCYKCLGYGHTRTTCTGPDRGKCCWRCGKPDHVGKDCRQTATCFLCAEAKRGDVGHVPGSGACAVFRAALEAKRGKTKT